MELEGSFRVMVLYDLAEQIDLDRLRGMSRSGAASTGAEL